MIPLFCFLLIAFEAIAAPLKVGTNAEFPPFCFYENKEIVGFDIDVAKEVASLMNQEIVFKDMPFDALIPDVIMGQVDFVAAGMSYSDERAKRVLFTKPYLTEDPLVLFSLAKHKLAMNELKGKSIIVIEGFMADLMMSEKKEVKLIRLSTQADGFMAIKSKRADGFVTAKSTVDAFLKTQDPALYEITLIDGSGETCALVVPKSKPAMLTEVQKALDVLEANGTMQILKAKWKLS